MATLPQTIHLATPLPGPEARALDERAGTALPRALTAAMPTFARRTTAVSWRTWTATVSSTSDQESR